MIYSLAVLVLAIAPAPFKHERQLKSIDDDWRPKFIGILRDQVSIEQSEVKRAVETSEANGASRETVYRTLLLVNAWRMKYRIEDDSKARISKSWARFPSGDSYEAHKARLFLREISWGSPEDVGVSKAMLQAEPTDKQLELNVLAILLGSAKGQDNDDAYQRTKTLQGEFPSLNILHAIRGMCCCNLGTRHKSERAQYFIEGIREINYFFSHARPGEDITPAKFYLRQMQNALKQDRSH